MGTCSGCSSGIAPDLVFCPDCGTPARDLGTPAPPPPPAAAAAGVHATQAGQAARAAVAGWQAGWQAGRPRPVAGGDPAGAGVWRPNHQGPFERQLPMHPLSIVGFILAFTPLAVVGLVLSVIALVKTSSETARYRGKGLALAGVIISLLALVTCGGWSLRA